MRDRTTLGRTHRVERVLTFAPDARQRSIGMNHHREVGVNAHGTVVPRYGGRRKHKHGLTPWSIRWRGPQHVRVLRQHIIPAVKKHACIQYGSHRKCYAWCCGVLWFAAKSRTHTESSIQLHYLKVHNKSIACCTLASCIWNVCKRPRQSKTSSHVRFALCDPPAQLAGAVPLGSRTWKGTRSDETEPHIAWYLLPLESRNGNSVQKIAIMFLFVIPSLALYSPQHMYIGARNNHPRTAIEDLLTVRPSISSDCKCYLYRVSQVSIVGTMECN